ncbi:MAG TPA: phosphate ABC transporter permease PstA [Bacteroidia bacterium]|nr:phosphate ABC transporter permease PstA [Bacteroidia bacterium]HNT80174.1 phosphate ABC transporter permease PstA [Bacteroidia bacterium]
MKRWSDIIFKYFGLACTFIGLFLLSVFIYKIISIGIERIDWNFLTNYPSRRPERAGILSAIMGSVWIIVLTAIISVPIGISAGLYLEEYGKGKTWYNKLIELNITNLAGVPSIIYGLLGLEIFNRSLSLGGSLLSGASTLALLILPIIIVSTREAVRAVPNSIREASFALGASKWQTVWRAVIPSSLSGILTGVILAISRAVGEAAPLIVVGALAYVPFVPNGPMSDFTVLPIQIFNWTSRPQHGFLVNASAAIIVLLAITLFLNLIVIIMRIRREKLTKK